MTVITDPTLAGLDPTLEVTVNLNKPVLLGFSGRKRAGKDTAAALLVNDYGFVRFAFADALKQAAIDINPVILNATDPRLSTRLAALCQTVTAFEVIKNDPEWDPGVREFLQHLGNGMRGVQQDIWSAPIVAAAAAHVAAGGRAVITDIRYPSEADLVSNAGGRIVRVYRSDVPHTPGVGEHVSETAMDDYLADHYLDTTPLATLDGRVTAMLAALDG